MAYKKDLRAAHLAASSRDKNHPLIRPVHEKIKDLKAQREEVFKQIKGPRNEAKKLFESEFKHLNLYLNGAEKDNINEIDNELVKKINFEIKNHPVEKIGLQLRKSMTEMKNLF